MIAIEDFVELGVKDLEVYVHGSEERLLQVPRRDRVNSLEAAKVLVKVKKEKRLQYWEEEALHGHYLLAAQN